MSTAKKSLSWLNPIEFTPNEARKFQESVDKGPSQEILRKQKKLFAIARNLLKRG